LHPGGSLGKRLASVDEVMRSVQECRIASSKASIRAMLVDAAKPGRRSGATMLVDDQQRLEGIFTDSDLARLLEQRRDCDLDSCIADLMTKSFSAIQSGARLTDAIDIMVQRKISELPVVNAEDRPVGLIDITDVIGIDHELTSEATGRHANDLNTSLKNDWPNSPSSLRLFGSDVFREES
jgi:arabinose-5-phosphate isomerase